MIFSVSSLCHSGCIERIFNPSASRINGFPIRLQIARTAPTIHSECPEIPSPGPKTTEEAA